MKPTKPTSPRKRSDLTSEERLALLERSPVPLMVFQDGWVVYVNAATYEVTGYRPELHGGSLLGRGAVDFVVPEEKPASVARLARTIESGAPTRNVLRTLWNPVTGRRLRVISSAAPITWRGKPAVEMSFLVLDSDGDPDAVDERSTRIQRLTERERQVAMGVAQGKRTEEIAAALGVRKLTVRTHLRNVYAKTGVHDRVELAHLMLGILARP